MIELDLKDITKSLTTITVVALGTYFLGATTFDAAKSLEVPGLVISMVGPTVDGLVRSSINRFFQNHDLLPLEDSDLREAIKKALKRTLENLEKRYRDQDKPDPNIAAALKELLLHFDFYFSGKQPITLQHLLAMHTRPMAVVGTTDPSEEYLKIYLETLQKIKPELNRFVQDDFIALNFGPQFARSFAEVLKEEDKPWRAMQLTVANNLQVGIAQLEHRTENIEKLALELVTWKQQLDDPTSPRSLIGTKALDKALGDALDRLARAMHDDFVAVQGTIKDESKATQKVITDQSATTQQVVIDQNASIQQLVIDQGSITQQVVKDENIDTRQIVIEQNIATRQEIKELLISLVPQPTPPSSTLLEKKRHKDASKQLLETDNLGTAVNLNNLAGLLYEQGNFTSARPLYERALKIREILLEPNHHDTALSLNNLANVLYAQGELDAARPLYERALKVRQQVPEPNNLDIVISLNNLAGLLHAQGDFAAARPLYERALKIRDDALSPNYPDIAISLNNLAGVLFAQGDFASARPLYERALKIRKDVLRANDPNIAFSLNNLAGVLFAQRDFAAARPLYEQALELRQRVLGPKHSDTAVSLNNLAGVLQELGEWDLAFQYYERALSISELALGSDHTSTQIVRDNLEELEGLVSDKDQEHG